MRQIDDIEKDFRKKRVPSFAVGDTVDVHIKITEGEKERIQIFSGIVIAKKNSGLSETFTVRRMVQGEGVERIFPIHSPKVEKVVVAKKGKVRRAKLYYLRGRVGRATRVEEKVGVFEKEGIQKEDVQVEVKPPKTEGQVETTTPATQEAQPPKK